jgi:AcrR family transcriptional regulator
VTRRTKTAGEERARDPERTKARILKAATDLFMKLGPTGASLDDISREAGVNRGLIYHYFKTKDTLFDCVLARPLAEFLDSQLEFLHTRTLDANGLCEATASFFRFLGMHPELVRLLSWTMAMRLPVDVANLELTRALYGRSVRHIEEAMAAGLLRKDLSAPHVLITVIDLCTAWHMQRDQWIEKLAFGERNRRELDEERLAAIQDLLRAAVAPIPATSASHP